MSTQGTAAKGRHGCRWGGSHGSGAWVPSGYGGGRSVWGSGVRRRVRLVALALAVCCVPWPRVVR